MKNLLQLFSIASILLLGSCAKLDQTNSIMVSDISRELPSQQNLTVPTMGNYLHFTTFTDSAGTLSTMLSEDRCLACNYALQEVLTESGSDEAVALPEQVSIGSGGNWKSPGYFHLNTFAGKGIRYIGFRSNINTSYSDESKWIYGWIRVNLAPDNYHLQVLQCAINLHTNEGIRTGQTANN